MIPKADPLNALQPLPVRARLYRGETLASYSHRLAAHNLSDVAAIEAGVRARGIRLPRRRVSVERAQIWRRLGQLDDHAFTTPEAVDGEAVLERELCTGCTRGEKAYGRRLDIGMICLRHRRWLGTPQRTIHTYPPALAAERTFRNHLAPRKVLFDSFAMDFGKLCASPIFMGNHELQRRTHEFRIDSTPILIYPEQVQLARLVTTASFLDYVTNPGHEAATRRQCVAAAVTQIIPDRADSEGWRTCDRVWEVVTKLTHLRHEAQLWGAPVRDPYYNLLRFIELPDLAAADIWAGRPPE
ncbi:hypothetical protein [Mycobacteroides abscessus]|uniref:Uncharacterized protein n=1 Tax=Mycobacteroides abscessus 21 TaxID=1299324 RepID=A0A829Q0Q7_9MYCO|nr:hypothetical protein [Mycobacteroides abscessus]EUA45887.1 hypothetical protein I543_2747 [Mycobacteroides abscessus 21]MBE5492920.1 hypothetical protein [Mycobacteroides abscessus]SHO95096.1 Uncharacterised protein [Mycobacteroides abscessus subsp. abscessus]SHP89129.1 Uncharacterised protein [Mycobacteroides abscessus subsp. abscessus]SHP92346.1 Uncharacterised protein [Mycobacteroides abscessus subsp. abscessus]